MNRQFQRLSHQFVLGIALQLTLVMGLLLLMSDRGGVINGALRWPLYGSLVVSVLLLWTCVRAQKTIDANVIAPINQALAVLVKSGVIARPEDDEAQAILSSVMQVDRIVSVDRIRQKVYALWNSVNNDEEAINGSLALFGEAGHILSGAYYHYDSFTDELRLTASYAFPENGKTVLKYGSGPAGEAAAQNRTVTLEDPDMSIPVGLGQIRPGLLGCFPVYGHRLHGVFVLAFPSRTTPDHVKIMQMYANQTGVVLDRIQQYDQLKKVSNDLRDRTKELNKELKHSISILNSSADGITILTPEGVITSFSRGAEAITGYTTTEVLGQPCCDILKHSSQDYEDLCDTSLCALCQATLTGEPATGKELYLTHKNGSRVPILLSVSPIKDENGKVIEVLQIFKDMTEIKNNLTALEQASRSKSEFLATMSHELRTPLNSVLGFAELLDAQSFGELNERQKRYVSNIMTAGKDLLTLINDILDLSRIEAGRMEWEREMVDIRQLIAGAVNLLREKAASNGLKMVINVDDTVDRFIGDERKIKQILYNLLSNAVKFTPSGGQVGVDAAIREGVLDLGVWDTGIGIPKDKWQTIFEPFYQVDNYLTRKHQGSGLGLALVKKMVSLPGGDIWVEVQDGKSTVFRLRLPQGPAMPTASVEPERVTPTVSVSLPTQLPSRRCLVIEDDRPTAELVETYLRGLGLETTIAASGEDGLAELTKQVPDLIVLDLLLPGMSGWDVLAQIRLSPFLSHVPVLITSILDEARKGLAVGAWDYLIKPIDKAQLSECVQRILRMRGQGYHALVIDDDPQARELISTHLELLHMQAHMAMTVEEGLQKAHALQPDVIFLDLMLPEVNGFEFLQRKEASQSISAIPVVVVSSKTLTADERRFLESRALVVARKSEFGKEDFNIKVLRLLKEGGTA